MDRLRSALAALWGTVVVLGVIVGAGVSMPFIKLAYFHHQVWTAVRARQWLTAAFIAFIVCLPLDFGLGIAAVWLITGQRPW
jgi:hypothetical protein